MQNGTWDTAKAQETPVEWIGAIRALGKDPLPLMQLSKLLDPSTFYGLRGPNVGAEGRSPWLRKECQERI